jgi:hypothetical protein
MHGRLACSRWRINGSTLRKEVVADLTLENRLLKKRVTADREDGKIRSLGKQVSPRQLHTSDSGPTSPPGPFPLPEPIP